MTIEKYFPHFHPLTGEDSQLPVFVSNTQIAEIQEYLISNTDEAEILRILDAFKNTKLDKLFFVKSNIFPSDEGKSHRAALQEILLSGISENKTLLIAITIIIKINHILHDFEYTFDCELKNAACNAQTIQRYFEVADIALAISDAFGEFQICKEARESTFFLRQSKERELSRTQAKKAATIKNKVFKDIKHKVKAILNNKRAHYLNGSSFRSKTETLIFKRIAKDIFWNELSDIERRSYPDYYKLHKLFGSDLERIKKEVSIKTSFNPYKVIANFVQEEYSQK